MDEQQIREKIEKIEKQIEDIKVDANKQLAYLQGQRDALIAVLEKPETEKPETEKPETDEPEKK